MVKESKLPREVCVRILSFLPEMDLLNLMHTSKQWNMTHYAYDDELWYNKFLRRGTFYSRTLLIPCTNPSSIEKAVYEAQEKWNPKRREVMARFERLLRDHQNSKAKYLKKKVKGAFDVQDFYFSTLKKDYNEWKAIEVEEAADIERKRKQFAEMHPLLSPTELEELYHRMPEVCIKNVFNGDGFTGKTSYLVTAATGIFPGEFTPTYVKYPSN